MKVLHLSNTPISNAPWNIMHCQELYSSVKPKLILGKKKSFSRVHNKGVLFLEYDKDALVEVFEATDVIHFHNFMWTQDIFKVHPYLRAIAEKKPRLIQYHSPRVNEKESFEDTIADKTIKHAVIAQYHVRVYPECEFVVPNMVPIYDQEYIGVPTKWEDASPVVSYAPSNVNGKTWDNKGYPETTGVLNELQRSFTFTKEVMVGVPYEECMTKKRWAHIGIDEFMTGSYHLSSLEYASMGCVLIGRVDELTQRAIAMVAGEQALAGMPWLQTKNADHFKVVMQNLLHTPVTELQKMGAFNRHWMETYWNPKNLVKIYEEAYKKL